MLDALPLSPGTLLLVVAATLYLIDAAELLYANEVLFAARGGGRGPWAAFLPAGSLQFARRALVLVQPWRPDLAVFRVAWPARSKEEPDELRTHLQTQLELLSGLRRPCLVLLLGIFVIVPFVYLWRGGAFAFLGALAACYGLVLFMLVLLARRRTALALPMTVFLGIAFESLICLPYAPNLYRKLTRRLIDADTSLVTLAEAFLDGAARTSLAAAVGASVKERLADGDCPPGIVMRLEHFRSELTQLTQ